MQSCWTAHLPNPPCLKLCGVPLEMPLGDRLNKLITPSPVMTAKYTYSAPELDNKGSPTPTRIGQGSVLRYPVKNAQKSYILIIFLPKFQILPKVGEFEQIAMSKWAEWVALIHLDQN